MRNPENEMPPTGGDRARADFKADAEILPDLAEARRFLELLDPEANEFPFQTFDDDEDRKDPRLAIIRHGILEQCAAELVRANRAGAGVFVMVQAGNGKGRSNANVTRIRGAFQEDDGEGKPLPLEPHIVVQSSPGKFHRYLLVDGLSPDDFRGVQARLVQDYGSDRQAQDPARVLRVPGFFHQKKSIRKGLDGTPRMVRIVETSGALPYTRDEILRTIPPVERPEPRRTAETEHVTVDPAVVRDLRSALLHMRSDDRELWIRMGMALKVLRETRRGLWLDWSATSEKFDPADAAAKWESFHPESTDYKAVFAEAQRQGWVNPTQAQSSSHPGDAGDRGDNLGAVRDFAGRRRSDNGRRWGEILDETAGFEPEPYPVEALGPLAEACAAIAEGGQMDPAVAGHCLMSVAALLTQARANVRTLAGDKPLSLFMLTVGESGDGKSTAEGAALFPVRDHQRRATAEYLEALKSRDADCATAKKAREPTPDKPRCPYIITRDGTVEGIRRGFAEGVPSQGVFTAEAAVMLAGYGMNGDNRAKTAGTFNGLWDDGEISVSRSLAGRLQLYDRRLSLHWLIQPDAAAETMNDPLLSGIGFWPRFLVTWPAPSKPRKADPFHPENDSRIRAFWDRCAALLAEPMGEDCGNLSTLEMAPEAHEFACRFFERMEQAAKGRGAKLDTIKPFALRATEQLFRVAGVQSAFAGYGAIDLATAQGAGQLVAYSLETWKNIFGARREVEARGHARMLFEWLAKQHEGRASDRGILRLGPKPLRSKSKRDAALAVLEQAGLVHALPRGYWSVRHER